MKYLIASSMAFLLMVGFVAGQEPEANEQVASDRQTRELHRQEARAERQDTKAKLQNERRANLAEEQEVRKKIKLEHQEFKSQVASERTELQRAFKQASTSEEKEALRADAQLAREKWQAEREVLRKERQDSFKNTLRARAQGLDRAFTNAHERGKDAIERLDNHLDTIANKGVDTNEAQEVLDTAKENLESAYTQANEALSQLQDLNYDAGPESLRNSFDESRESLRLAREAMKASFEEIKKAAEVAKEAIRQYREEMKVRAQNRASEVEEEGDSE
ncbi:MAG: hypothetical protein ACKKL4_02730 [Patescibacteria group bacterium]